jgi:hypothetical protein
VKLSFASVIVAASMTAGAKTNPLVPKLHLGTQLVPAKLYFASVSPSGAGEASFADKGVPKYNLGTRDHLKASREFEVIAPRKNARLP